MTQSKIHLLGLIVLYLGVGSCSAKKHKILLKIDALDTGAAGCTSLYGCPWLAPGLSTHSSEDDDSKGSDLGGLKLHLYPISDPPRPLPRAPDSNCPPLLSLPPPPPPGAPRLESPSQDLGLLIVSHRASMRPGEPNSTRPPSPLQARTAFLYGWGHLGLA